MINKEFKSITELFKAFPDEHTCIEHLEILRWDGEVISPFDNTSKVYKCKNNRYRCANTKKYFNVKTNTLFDNTKISLQKWFLAIWIVTSHKKGISSLQLSRDLDVTQKTAWFMLQRIRKCFDIENNNDLDNTIGVDETYVGGKNKNRHTHKKVEQSHGRSFKDKISVIGMIERDGKSNAYAVENVKAATLSKEIYTNEWLGYKGLDRIYDHAIVKHGQKQYVDGRVHTSTIEGFWSLLKRGIVGIYHFISQKHLQIYVDEVVFRYNTRKYGETDRLNLMLSNMEVKTTYRRLICG